MTLMNSSIFAFLNDYDHQEPCLVMDLDHIHNKYNEFVTLMPDTSLHYAVKANPHIDILKCLVKQGSNFDAASFAEVDLCLKAGAKAEQISFSNTIKRPDDIKNAFANGVNLFSADAPAEIDKIASCAPGSDITIRILCDCKGADWPLSRKFGCDKIMAIDLLKYSAELGLNPRGITFHVGSQQLMSNAWDDAIKNCFDIFDAAKQIGVNLDLINLGGGFPTDYTKSAPKLQEFSKQINLSLNKHFGDNAPKTIIEPGRGLVADAGIIQTEILLISQKSHSDKIKWLFLDIGKFGGLIETMDEAIRYPIITNKDNDEKQEYIIAGPTCDSVDVLYEKQPYPLPKSLEIGDKIWIKSTGAYTASYSSICFNGFNPLKTFCI